MKKSLFALLLLSIASILADQPIVLSSRQTQGTGPLEIDGLVYSQTYTFESLDIAILNSSGVNYWVCDDFELDDNYYVTEMCVWMIWTGEHATVMNFVISEDNTGDSDPNTNIDVWAESVPCTNTFTGDQAFGYDVYETYCTINAGAYPELDAGAHYYFETQAVTPDNSYILADVNMVSGGCWYWTEGEWHEIINMSGYPHMFFDFYGEPMNTLESETWGSIKTLF